MKNMAALPDKVNQNDSCKNYDAPPHAMPAHTRRFDFDELSNVVLCA
jgi:hypothetical protein